MRTMQPSRRVSRFPVVLALLLMAAAVGACGEPTAGGGTRAPTTPTLLLSDPLATDAFNRANENPIAGNWTPGPGVAADLQLLNNAVTAVAEPDPNGVAFWSAITWPADQWSEVTIQAVPITGDAGPAVRIAAGVATYYLAGVFSDGSVGIFRSIDHSFTQLSAGVPGTVVAGDRVRLEVEGTALRVFRNGVLVGEAEDAEIASGSAGMYQDNTSAALDDWAGGAVGSSPPGGTFSNEPAGYSAVTDFPFNSWDDGWTPQGNMSIVTDATAPLSPPNIGQVFYFQGFEAGSDPGMMFNPHTFSSHFVGYWFKYSNPYSNHPNGTKQWYPNDQESGGNYYVLFRGEDGKIQVTIQPDGEGDLTQNLASNISNPTITLGVWHKFELHFDYPNGNLRWWIDGVLCGQHLDMNWPNRSGHFVEMKLAPTWGGTGGSVPFDSWWWVDHLYVSTP